MGQCTVRLSPEATDELRVLHRLGDKSILRKIEKILYELSEHRPIGTGQVERLWGEIRKTGLSTKSRMHR